MKEPMVQFVDPSSHPRRVALVTAVNFYVSTGDLVGMGTYVELEPRVWSLWIPVNPSNPIDVRDFEAFRARVDDLPCAWNVQLERRSWVPETGFLCWLLHVPEGHVQDVTLALLERPGPLGWGSLVDGLVDSPELEEQVASLGLPQVPEPIEAELHRRMTRRLRLRRN